MNFTEVLAEVAGMTPANQAMLDQIANQLGVPANPDFTLLQQAVMAHLAATPTDPAPAIVAALVQAHRILIGTAVPAAAPAAPTTSTEYTNTQVGEVVRQVPPADLTTMQAFATAYAVATAGRNFYQLRGDVESALSANPTDPAPVGVDPIMHAWETAHPAAPARAGRGFMNRKNGIIAGAAVAAVVFLALVAWKMDVVGGESSPRDQLIALVEDEKFNEVDNLLESEDFDFDDDDVEMVKQALEKLVTDAKSGDIDDDDLTKALVDAFEELDDEPDGKDIVDAINEARKDLTESADEDPSPSVSPSASPSASQSATASATAKPSGTPSPDTSSKNTLQPGSKPSYNANAFRHPNQFVKCQKTFDPVANQVDWLLCEPGVLLTNTATFTRPEVDMVYHTNCPEGGFWYGSMHHGTVNVKGVGIEIPDRGAGTNHLVVIRCALSDGKRDVDLNTTMDVGNFVIGHAIWSPIPPNHPDGSAYVSMEWFGEQLITSHTTGGTNCGSNGCSKVYVVLYDVNSQSMQTLLATNIAGETSDADSDGIVDYASANWELVSSNR